MKTRNSYALLAVIAAALALSGWSCGNGYSVSNNNDAGSQPQTYQNSEWGVSFSYPAGWQYREYRETIDGQEETTLAFSDQALPDTLPPEPLFPVTVFYDTGTVDDIVATYTDAVSVEDVMLGGKTVKKVVYFSNMLDKNDTVYVAPLRNGSLKFFSLQEVDYPAVTESMISSITENE